MWARDGKWEGLEVRAKEIEASPNRAGVAEPRLKIWDNNLGQTDGQTDRQDQIQSCSATKKDVVSHSQTPTWANAG